MPTGPRRVEGAVTSCTQARLIRAQASLLLLPAAAPQGNAGSELGEGLKRYRQSIFKLEYKVRRLGSSGGDSDASGSGAPAVETRPHAVGEWLAVGLAGKWGLQRAAGGRVSQRHVWVLPGMHAWQARAGR